MGVLSIEEVLQQEVAAIGGQDEEAERGAVLAAAPGGQQAHDTRTHLNADDRERPALDAAAAAEVERRKAFYRNLAKLNRAALCCSGGGIRSATFCLGVIQALANYDVGRAPPPKKSTAAKTTGVKQPTIDPKNSLLGRFHFLSTVSGGGYIGSWLSAWRARADFDSIIRNLTGRPLGPDVEAPEISWLRAYSNYLTPRIGIGSADSWAAVAICIRNLILNWLVIIPVVCLVLLALKLIAAVSVWIAHTVDHTTGMNAIAILGLVFLIGAQAFTTYHRPARRPPNADPAQQSGDVDQPRFVRCDLTGAVASAIFLTVFFSSKYFCSRLPGWIDSLLTQLDLVAKAQQFGLSLRTEVLLVFAVSGLLVYAVGWLFGRRLRDGFRDFIWWAASGLIYGAVVGIGAYLFYALTPYAVAPGKRDLLVALVFGVPWMLMAQLVAEIVFVGLASYERNSDPDREWLGRAAGWLAVAAIAWALTAFLVFVGAYTVQKLIDYGYHYVLASGGITAVASGLVTALLGKSSKAPAVAGGSDQSDLTTIASNIALAIAGPIFAAALIVALSMGLDRILIHDSLVARLAQLTHEAGLSPILVPLLIAIVVTFAIGAIASRCVNINRFSLHALYRNRLVRAYLGASRKIRHPDRFTGFDGKDNIRVHELWPPHLEHGTKSTALFHVVNITLNLVSSKRLAWQQRKAEPFTVSPLHCGSANLGYRASSEYGDGPHKETYGCLWRGKAAASKPAAAETHTNKTHPGAGKPGHKYGIALGTAMAISGAAASPNMGYLSSPSLSLLLTLFNVRLGWWLGNPGKHGDKTYQHEGPECAAAPLFSEAFGLTTDDRPYVYLSDGGHFENLALYEMVRRRCRFIVAIDAGCDPTFTFEDLGNAVRKIYIDLGIRIRFQGLDKLSNHPQDAKGKPAGNAEPIPYYAIGMIDYASADDGDPADNGYILYIKPAYHGTEGAGIISYAASNKDFPHETTLDQWFTESQFESYRSLGLEITNDILEHEVALRPDPNAVTLHGLLAALRAPT